jgi:diguanylate cyclase (GGDEF)-like protein
VTPDTTLDRLREDLPETIPDWPRVQASTGIRTAARMLAETPAQGLILIENDTPTGIVTANALLGALSLDIDAVTRLPRSGALRDWLSERLRERREVAVLFIDIDDFGEINRAHGHTAGDEALANSARTIGSLCSDTEFAARFGGDEFAIATVMPNEQARALAVKIEAALPLSASVGLAGGRRSGVREDSNVGATVEELIRLASLDCLKIKAIRKKTRERL